MLCSVLNLKLRQAVGSFEAGAVLKFLAPDFIIGLFMALSIGWKPPAQYAGSTGLIACGIALFTLIVGTRKLFFTGGDVESFYFVEPTSISRFASLATMVILSAVIVLAVAIPTLILTAFRTSFLQPILRASLSSVCFSVTIYLFVVFAIAAFPKRIAHATLTIVQIIMALILLEVFQFSSSSSVFSDSFGFRAMISCGSFLFVALIYLVSPVQEILVFKLAEYESHSNMDLSSKVEQFKRILFLKSEEEEAGFLFFLTNVFRNQALRLSTVGMAVTPVMVAIYWISRGSHFVTLGFHGIYFSSRFAMPIASLVSAGIVVHYFLSQNLLSSRDYEASWLFKANQEFSYGKFVRGIRKSFLATIQAPMTAAIFLVILRENSFLESFLTALTFYFITHVAASTFSVLQKDFPLSLPFTQVGSHGVMDLFFFIFYSLAVTTILFVSYDNLEKLLMINLFAFILVYVLEFFSARIVDKRMTLNA